MNHEAPIAVDAARSPLLIVPGAWTTAAAFDDVATDLRRRGHRTDVVDLPARSRRLPQLDRGGLAAIDRALDDAIAEHDSPPVLIGHSLGGLAALRASRRHDLPALVLLMPAPPSGLLRTIAPDLVRHPINTVALLGTSISVRLLSRVSTRTPAGLYSRSATPQTLRRAQAFRADESWTVLLNLLIGTREPTEPTGIPTLVIAGAQDQITPTAIVRPLAGALGATFQELDVAHAFNEEPTHTNVTDVVADFLASVDVERKANTEERRGPTGAPGGPGSGLR